MSQTKRTTLNHHTAELRTAHGQYADGDSMMGYSMLFVII